VRFSTLFVALIIGSAQTRSVALPLHDDHDHDPETFKETLHRTVRASRENLRPLKTSRIEKYPGRDYWYEVETTLPGAQICRIYEHPQMVYRCEWKRAANQTPRSLYETAARQFAEALGTTDWQIRSSSKGAVSTRLNR
jgi:hypothetical protein